MSANTRVIGAARTALSFQKAFLEFVSLQSDKPVPAGLRRRVFLRLLAEESRENL